MFLCFEDLMNYSPVYTTEVITVFITSINHRDYKL